MVKQAISHIKNIAQIPSFSSYEERLHPYMHQVFENVDGAKELSVPGNNLIYKIERNPNKRYIAFAAHLDKINHYGTDYPNPLPVDMVNGQIEGAMDDSAGMGIVTTLAEQAATHDWPNVLFFFSEMEEKKGLKEHPELLKEHGKGRTHGMGARRIAEACIKQDIIPKQVITVDTTPLFKGEQGIALYANHWELNDLTPSKFLKKETKRVVQRFLDIDSDIRVDNNTNDYLHYGKKFNEQSDEPIVSIALEPSIYPYHQKGERVFVDDIQRCLNILRRYLDTFSL
ncbi:M28 family peptidase [Fodinibius sp. N2]|uniref:M28 family peptidase n=1 Tax=Fodinibius alkaliphilus TaxID=3140241 RepID=UPI003159D3D5